MSSRLLGQCLVCDADAVGVNFGVPTCAPCKVFFRRNAVQLGVSLLSTNTLLLILFWTFRNVILFVNTMVIVQ